jgi:hypothetical protein
MDQLHALVLLVINIMSDGGAGPIMALKLGHAWQHHVSVITLLQSATGLSGPPHLLPARHAAGAALPSPGGRL